MTLAVAITAVKSIHVFGMSTTRRSLSSAVIFSASRKRPRLSALHLRNTASLLAPEWRYLAPCLGATLTACPFAGNLTRMGQLVHPEALHYYSSSPDSTELFQASRLASSLFFQLIRESPLHVTRTKSLPAAYLTPSIMGTLLGLSLSTNTDPKRIPSTMRKRHGIKSNYIHDTQWTGVSLTRWMDLVPTKVRGGNKTLSLVSSIWLMALWELSNSKSDFCDFWISLEQMLPGCHILDPSNPLAQAIVHDPLAREEWVNEQFDESQDLSNDQVDASMDRILFPGRNSQSLEYAHDLEIICAAISLNHLPLEGKPACPTGYYGFDGGSIQADCAEHTAREIVNLLLWDESKHHFDLSRLPSSASPRLVELYDESIHSLDESGAAWFQLLSDLPGCLYLAKSPTGRPYELAPTVSNILCALQQLLVGTIEPPWKGFQDLANMWTSNALHIYESTLTHRSSTTGELLHHEFVTLHMDNSPTGIELRLRCDMTKNSGMSKVTHLRERQPILKDADQLASLLAQSGPMTNKILGLAVCGDVPFRDGAFPSNPQANTLHMLATSFGCDRRWLLTTDIQESVRSAATLQSEKILKSAIGQACQWSHTDELFGATILPWLLSESPIVFEGHLPSVRIVDSDVETWVLSLPDSLLSNDTIQDALEYNWAIRGQPLSAWARWKSGRSSVTTEARHLRMIDVPPFLSFCLTKNKFLS